MAYNVILTDKARQQLDAYICYLLNTLHSEEAADNLLGRAEMTISTLAHSAESFAVCSDPALKAFGYRKIFLPQSRYLFVYSVSGNTVYIEGMYHELQDYENLFKSGS